MLPLVNEKTQNKNKTDIKGVGRRGKTMQGLLAPDWKRLKFAMHSMMSFKLN